MEWVLICLFFKIAHSIFYVLIDNGLPLGLIVTSLNTILIEENNVTDFNIFLNNSVHKGFNKFPSFICFIWEY